MTYQEYNLLNYNQNIEKILKDKIEQVKDNLIITKSGSLWKFDTKDKKLLRIKSKDKFTNITKDNIIVGINEIYKYDNENDELLSTNIYNFDEFISSSKDYIVIREKSSLYSLSIYSHDGKLLIPHDIGAIHSVLHIDDIDSIRIFLGCSLRDYLEIYNDSVIYLKTKKMKGKYDIVITSFIYNNTLYGTIDSNLVFPILNNIENILYVDSEKVLLKLKYYKQCVLVDYDFNIIRKFTYDNLALGPRYNIKNPYLNYCYENEDKKGVLDVYGNKVTEPEFCEIVNLKDEYFYYEDHSSFGIYNVKAKEKKPINYFYCGTDAEHEMIHVINDETLNGIMDIKGNLLVDCISEEKIKIINEKFYIFKQGSKYGVGNFYSNFYNNPIYDDVKISDNFVKLDQGNASYIMNMDGKIIKPLNNINSSDIKFITDTNICVAISENKINNESNCFFFEIYNEKLEKILDTTKCDNKKCIEAKLLSSEILALNTLNEQKNIECNHFLINNMKYSYVINIDDDNNSEKKFKTLKKLKKYQDKIDKKYK